MFQHIPPFLQFLLQIYLYSTQMRSHAVVIPWLFVCLNCTARSNPIYVRIVDTSALCAPPGQRFSLPQFWSLYSILSSVFPSPSAAYPDRGVPSGCLIGSHLCYWQKQLPFPPPASPSFSRGCVGFLGRIWHDIINP